MNCSKAASLPLIADVCPSWWRSVPPNRQWVNGPPPVSTDPTRFNPGHDVLHLLYFASDPLVARFEARDLLGQFFGKHVPASELRHVIVEYAINPGEQIAICDASETRLPIIDTTVQEMTGEWRAYPFGAANAPTQDLAVAIYHRADKPKGLIAPSARNPCTNNLILFPDRLPDSSVYPVHIEGP